jgi:hypothetical protein
LTDAAISHFDSIRVPSKSKINNSNAVFPIPSSI